MIWFYKVIQILGYILMFMGAIKVGEIINDFLYKRGK